MSSDAQALIFATVLATVLFVVGQIRIRRQGRPQVAVPIVILVWVLGMALFFALWWFALRKLFDDG